MKLLRFSTSSYLAYALSLLIYTAPAKVRADVTSGDSYGFGLKLDVGSNTGATLSLLGGNSNTTGLLGVSANTTRLPSTAFGTAPNPYATGVQSVVQTFAAGNLASTTGLNISVIGISAGATFDLASVGGTFNGSASSTVNGSTGNKTATGLGSVNNLRLELVDTSITATVIATTTLNPAPLLKFTQAANTTLQSISTVAGDFNSFNRTGTSLIADLGISVNGAANVSLSSILTGASVSYTVDGNGNISVAPNTILTLGVGASANWPGLGSGLISGMTLGSGSSLQLTLNKQVISGNLNTNPMITTTALDIQLIGVQTDLGIPTLASLHTSSNIGIALGQSHAALTGILSASPVPEPATVLFGFSLLATASISRRRRAASR